MTSNFRYDIKLSFYIINMENIRMQPALDDASVARWEKKLCSIDFGDEETVRRLQDNSTDIFKDDKDASFISFLRRLQEEVLSGDRESLRTMLGIRRKIKQGRILTQKEIEMAQSVGLHHWKGANIEGGFFGSMENGDFRETLADFTEIKGSIHHTIWSNLRGQTILGDNQMQIIEGNNKDQIILGANLFQTIRGKNENQRVEGENRVDECTEHEKQVKIFNAIHKALSWQREREGDV